MASETFRLKLLNKAYLTIKFWHIIYLPPSFRYTELLTPQNSWWTTFRSLRIAPLGKLLVPVTIEALLKVKDHVSPEHDLELQKYEIKGERRGHDRTTSDT